MESDVLNIMIKEKDRIDKKLAILSKKLTIIDKFIKEYGGLNKGKIDNAKSDDINNVNDNIIDDSKVNDLTPTKKTVYKALVSIGGNGTKTEVANKIQKMYPEHSNKRCDSMARNYLPKLLKDGLIDRKENELKIFVYSIKQ